ncbi:hypothetical protein MCG45_16195 [Clostridium perfringens]|uniref:hypothetical protein n=1 Tax=Clostridium perfringens TaxID=1502 RepID=UPI001F062D83|nr:hypothetical protein [Clostridium perfringens]MCH1964371.1 hypothetical protein [Clostridium perfringens]
MKDIFETVKDLKKVHNNKKIELGKEYWVSEWSWSPICDGYIPHQEIIEFAEKIDGYNVYTTGTNYRYYFAWDIYNTKEEAEVMCKFKGKYGYDWCTKVEHSLINYSLY